MGWYDPQSEYTANSRRLERQQNEVIQFALQGEFGLESPSSEDLDDFHSRIDEAGEAWEADYKNLVLEMEISHRTDIIIFDLCVY